NIMSGGQQLLLSGRWWPTFFPGLMILLTTLALNILSEGMTDAMAAPRTRASGKTGDDSTGPAEESESTAGSDAPAAAAAPAENDARAGEHDRVLGLGGSQAELQQRLAELRASE